MREILFRGKLASTGEWAEGNLRISKQYVSVITPDESPVGVYGKVDPKTMGQYIGIKDKNGKRIFEGDIVKHFNNSNEEYDIGEIYYDINNVWWRRTGNGNCRKKTVISYQLSLTCVYEVIGNIHDNPEILKGGVDND